MQTQDPHSRAPIVAAFSPRSASRETIEFGLAASRIMGAPLIVAAVREGSAVLHRVGGDESSEGHEERTLAHLRQGLDRLDHRDVEIRVFEDRTVARGLARAIDELAPALIVLGSTRRGSMGSALLGTTAERVIHTSPCPVAVVPIGYERPETGVQIIGAAFSPTPEGREALEVAAGLARGGGVRLRAITVVDPEHAGEQSAGLMARQHRDTAPAEEEAARHRLDVERELRETIADLGVDVDVDVLVNDPADGLAAASKAVDLLVMGSRGLGPKRAVVLGSVSRKLADRSACPLLIIPRGAGSPQVRPPSKPVVNA